MKRQVLKQRAERTAKAEDEADINWDDDEEEVSIPGSLQGVYIFQELTTHSPPLSTPTGQSNLKNPLSIPSRQEFWCFEQGNENSISEGKFFEVFSQNFIHLPQFIE